MYYEYDYDGKKKKKELHKSHTQILDKAIVLSGPSGR